MKCSTVDSVKILLAGSQGQVGWELRQALALVGKVIALDRQSFDLTKEDQIRNTIREVCPDVIVNAAAYTAVDRAESEPEIAMQVNGIAPGVIAEEAKHIGATLVHYSTDYVFDGTKADPYIEEDVPNPLNVYGKSKLAGEQAIQAVGGKFYVFRTSWVYSSTGKNFLKTIMKLATERDELKIVDDQVGSPTWSRDIAGATRQVIGDLTFERSKGKGDVETRLGSHYGIYNMTSYGSTSWYGFAQAILGEMASLGGVRCQLARLVAIPTSQYPLPATRPCNSRLSNEKIRQEFGISLPLWNESLARVMAHNSFSDAVPSR